MDFQLQFQDIFIEKTHIQCYFTNKQGLFVNNLNNQLNYDRDKESSRQFYQKWKSESKKNYIKFQKKPTNFDCFSLFPKKNFSFNFLIVRNIRGVDHSMLFNLFSIYGFVNQIFLQEGSKTALVFYQSKINCQDAQEYLDSKVVNGYKI